MNIGTGKSYSIYAIAEIIGRQLGWAGNIKWDKNKPDGQARRELDITRMTEKLNFVPEMTLVRGLKRTIDWWRQNNG